MKNQEMSSVNRTLTKWEPEYGGDHDSMRQVSIWRTKIAPLALHNDDGWNESETVKKSKNDEGKSAEEKKAKRNKALTIAAAAAAIGVALAGVAIHEWDKHKDAKRKECYKSEKESQHMPGEYSTFNHQSSGNSSK